jgi:[ribosomal protein S5]-alanine N-acetyltransferase
MKLTTPLLTARLVLRTLSAADATDRYLGWMRDREATRFLESRLVDHDLGSLHDYIASCNDAPASMLLGICLADATHIGNIKLGPIDPYHQHAAIGLLIGERDLWGNGYATEAIAAVTAHAFSEMGLQKLYAGCYASNVGSARAFLKAGWIEEGRNRAHWRSDGGREDNVQLGITRADWSASQS